MFRLNTLSVRNPIINLNNVNLKKSTTILHLCATGYISQGIKHWGMSLMDQQESPAQILKNRPVVLRNRRQKKKTTDAIINLPYFFYNFTKDHSLPNLIWNHKVHLQFTQHTN